MTKLATSKNDTRKRRHARVQCLIGVRGFDDLHDDLLRVAVQIVVADEIGPREVDRDGKVRRNRGVAVERCRNDVLGCAILLALIPQVDAQAQPAGRAEDV